VSRRPPVFVSAWVRSSTWKLVPSRLQDPGRLGLDLRDRAVLDDQGGDPVAAVAPLQEEVAVDVRLQPDRARPRAR
jgi:hypothetical protein